VAPSCLARSEVVQSNKLARAANRAALLHTSSASPTHFVLNMRAEAEGIPMKRALGLTRHQHVGLGGTDATLDVLYKNRRPLAVIPDTTVRDFGHETM
jgi:hypothetical protein